jgi:hypothetical protein
MISFQTKLLGALEEIATKAGLDVVQEAQWANNGRVLAQRGFTTVAQFTYDFQNYASTILINGAQHGPPGIDNFFFEAIDDQRISQLLARWETLCKDCEGIR